MFSVKVYTWKHALFNNMINFEKTKMHFRKIFIIKHESYSIFYLRCLSKLKEKEDQFGSTKRYKIKFNLLLKMWFHYSAEFWNTNHSTWVWKFVRVQEFYDTFGKNVWRVRGIKNSSAWDWSWYSSNKWRKFTPYATGKTFIFSKPFQEK